ncbi:unnamed protein product, partial [Rotaria socialis]
NSTKYFNKKKQQQQFRFVGYPNDGKSTLISMMDTLIFDDRRPSFTIADLPALIQWMKYQQ